MWQTELQQVLNWLAEDQQDMSDVQKRANAAWKSQQNCYGHAIRNRVCLSEVQLDFHIWSSCLPPNKMQLSFYLMSNRLWVKSKIDYLARLPDSSCNRVRVDFFGVHGMQVIGNQIKYASSLMCASFAWSNKTQGLDVSTTNLESKVATRDDSKELWSYVDIFEREIGADRSKPKSTNLNSRFAN